MEEISIELRNVESEKSNEQSPSLKKILRKKTVFTVPNHIEQHQHKVSGKVQYHCSICKKTFSSRSQCYYHIGCADASAKKFHCEQCKKSFSSRSHLNYHLEAHSTTVYECGYCAKTFTNRIVLKKHEKHHQAVKLQCEKCFKSFCSKDSLALHMRQHSSSPSFTCEICDKKYTVKSTMKQHMLKHYSKKHECATCGKQFQRNSTLRLHMKRHTKTEAVECMTCMKKFSDPNAMARHMKLHKQSPRFKCKQCDISTVRKDNMLRHVRNMHTGENFNECVELILPFHKAIEPTSQSTTSAKVDNQTQSADLNLPKTIENSSVIKCIGNVEPVKIPTICSPVTEKCENSPQMSEMHEAASASKCQKSRKKYDPIEMYRRILISDEEDEAEDNMESEFQQTDAPEPSQTIDQTSQQPRTSTITNAGSLNCSKFSEMHWRKNYKYTYEYQNY